MCPGDVPIDITACDSCNVPTDITTCDESSRLIDDFFRSDLNLSEDYQNEKP